MADAARLISSLANGLLPGSRPVPATVAAPPRGWQGARVARLRRRPEAGRSRPPHRGELGRLDPQQVLPIYFAIALTHERTFVVSRGCALPVRPDDRPFVVRTSPDRRFPVVGLGLGGVVFEVLAESIESLRGVLATLDPAVLEGADAKRLVEQFVELERLAAAGRTLAVPRVAETGAWQVDGAYRDVSAWLAAKTQSTVGRAKATVETAGRLAELPETAAALRAGRALGGAGGGDRGRGERGSAGARRRCWSAAARNGVKGLKDECAGWKRRRRRIRRSATSRARANAVLCGIGGSPMSRG